MLAGHVLSNCGGHAHDLELIAMLSRQELRTV